MIDDDPNATEYRESETPVRRKVANVDPASEQTGCGEKKVVDYPLGNRLGP
jgi:hypothetical protein